MKKERSKDKYIYKNFLLEHLGMLKIIQTGCNKHVKVHRFNEPNDKIS